MITVTAKFRRTSPVLSRQHGVGLVEVLVSVLILGIGMLGIAAMQATALRYGQSSMETSQAVIQTYSILERMRANAGQAMSYNTAGMICDVPAGGSLAQNDVSEWIGALKQTLGTVNDDTTCGQITNCPNDCTIIVEWDDSRARDGSGERQIRTETRL